MCALTGPLIEFPPPNWPTSIVSYSISVPSLVLGEGLKFLPLSWDSACLNEQDPFANLRHVPRCASDEVFSDYSDCTHNSLCVRASLISHQRLLISSLHPSSHHASFKVINFFIRIFQHSVLLWEDNWIRLFSWVHAWGKCENVAFAVSHQKQSAALLIQYRSLSVRKHKSAWDDLGSHVNFSVLPYRNFVSLSAVLSSSLMNPFPLCRSPVAVGHGCYCLALLRSVPAAAYIVLVTVLRYHLFIWSVFSPKLLYESMHLLLTAGVCLFFNTMDQSHSSSKS